MKKHYNKLIRNKIPSHIKQNLSTEVLVGGERMLYLDKKLEEEIDEYRKSGDVMELVDMVEVIKAIHREMNLTDEQFEYLRRSKEQEKGSFSEMIKLNWVEINDNPPLYDVYINGKFVASVENEEKAWELIGEYPFGSGYEAFHHGTTEHAEQFIPF